MALITFTQTGNAMTHSQQQWCSDITVEAGTSGSSEIDIAAAGSATSSVTQDNGDPEERGLYMESTAVGVTDWAAPTVGNPYIVRLNVTTSAQMDWTSCHICRVNASGVNQQTMSTDANSSDFPIGLNSTGVKIATFTGGNSTASAATTDRLAIVCSFTESTGHNPVTITVTWDQDITTPIDDGLSTAAPFGHQETDQQFAAYAATRLGGLLQQ